MSDMGYGVYVRIQNATGALWSTNRSEQSEVEADLDTAFGVEFRKALMGSLKGGFVKEQPPAKVVPLPAQAEVVVATEDEVVSMSLEEVADALEATATADEPAPQFDVCEVCGTVKDKWNPPGISKAGKKYPGFFGCPNFRNHPR